MVTVSVPALVVIAIPVLAANVNVSVAESAATFQERMTLLEIEKGRCGFANSNA